MAQWHNGAMAQWHNGATAQRHNGKIKSISRIKPLRRCAFFSSVAPLRRCAVSYPNGLSPRLTSRRENVTRQFDIGKQKCLLLANKIISL